MAEDRGLILVTNYKGTPYTLNGCENDGFDGVDFFSSVLPLALSFPQGALRVLMGRNMSAANMRKYLDWVTDPVSYSPGDKRLIWYSGHGTQTEQFAQDEADGKSEVLCPNDFSFESNSLFITDNQMHAWMKRVSGVAVFDCCHSGGNTRGVLPATQPKFIPKPYDIGFNFNQAVEKAPNPELNWAILTGCKENQTSLDVSFGGRPNGALTAITLKEVWPKNLDASFAEIALRVGARCHQYGFDQDPQAEGLLRNKSLAQIWAR